MTNLSSQLSKHFKEVFFGGNWTASNVEDKLKDVTWQQALTQNGDHNSIATLTYHMFYYVKAVLKVFEGGPLEAKDEYSFSHPEIKDEKTWREMVDSGLDAAKKLTKAIEEHPSDGWFNDFVDPKYGNYYRNIHGMIEHTHYHLGQIALIKKGLG